MLPIEFAQYCPKFIQVSSYLEYFPRCCYCWKVWCYYMSKVPGLTPHIKELKLGLRS